MPKLHLKRTPEEEAQHQRRKERKRKEKEASGKRKRKAHAYDVWEEDPLAQKRRREDGDMGEGPSTGTARKWASSDEDEEELQHGPQPAGASTAPPAGHKPDYDAIRAEIEEQRFREKMFDALGDDERLDSVEAKLNDFAHVPDRWRAAGKGGVHRVFEDEFEDVLRMDPQMMDEEEYAEWIRLGMYRKTHAEEYAEQQRKKAMREARKAEEKARKAETARLEKEAEEERKRRKRERESRKWDYAREEYHLRWKILLASGGSEEGDSAQAEELRFEDIPWPVVAAHRLKKPEKRQRSSRHEEEETAALSVEDLTADAISAFILPLVSEKVGDEGDKEKAKKVRKEKLRETFLRFHPDKFEGRFMARVRESDRARVREGIGQVSRVLNGLMG